MLLMLGGSAIKSGAGIYGATQAIKQSKYQQDILDYQAQYVDAATKIEAAKIDRAVKQTVSTQRATTAASGFQADSGTPLELQIDTAMQGDIDKAILRQAGGIEKLRLQNAGTMARAQGYGVAAGLYAGASGTLLNTTMAYGSREGWFAPKTPEPSYPRNYRSFN
jgi:hypothetical protein